MLFIVSKFDFVIDKNEIALHHFIKQYKNLRMSVSNASQEIVISYEPSDAERQFSVFRDAKTDKIIVRGFPRSQEYVGKEFKDQIYRHQYIDVTAFKIYESLEGTIIRVFYYGDKWFTATSSKLDAFKSKWASIRKTFGEHFQEKICYYTNFTCLDDFYATLDKSKRYLFLLSPTEEERIVCTNDSVYLIGTEDSETHIIDFDAQIENISKPRRIYELTTYDDVIKYVEKQQHYSLAQGILMFRYLPNYKVCEKFGTVTEELPPILDSIKVISSEYQTRYNIRNNVPSLRFRYLQMRGNGLDFDDFVVCCYPHMRDFTKNIGEEIEKGNGADLDLFFEMYPHMRDVAKKIEETIYKICDNLHKLYLKIYIEKNSFVNCTPEESMALKIIHDVYLKKRIKTTPTRINDILTANNPTIINKLLRSINRKKSE